MNSSVPSFLRKARCLLLLAFLAVGHLAFADTLTYSEDYAEKAIKFKDGSDVFYEVVPRGTFSVKVTMSLKDQDVDITNFDEQTPISFSVGDFSFEEALGNDPHYKVGKKSATFIQYAESDSDKPGPKVLKVTVTWSAKSVTVKVVGTTPDFVTGIAAANFVGEDAGKFKPEFEASLQFDSATQTFDCSGKGSLKYKNVGKGDNLVTVATVSLSGSGKEQTQE